MTVKPPSLDFYKILSVSRTATSHEIKQAYRKLAMALHPDRTAGDPHKANVFKAASEAYNVLSDHSKRTAYDSIAHPKHTQQRRPPPANYRKVYSPRAPPGFKTFDPKRHYDMHYGDGMMREEVERVRRRAEQASSRNSGYDYESPLGKGFSFSSENDHNPYSKRARQGPPQGMFSVEYEETHYYDLGSSDTARHVVSSQQEIRERMHERRKNRIDRRRQQQPPQREEEATGCSIM
jgi:molecular chaperone DnaJ